MLHIIEGVNAGLSTCKCCDKERNKEEEEVLV